jgi:hypothetical protein
MPALIDQPTTRREKLPEPLTGDRCHPPALWINLSWWPGSSRRRTSGVPVVGQPLKLKK